MWGMVGLFVVTGYVLLDTVGESWPWQLLAFALIIMPVAMAANITAGRRRAQRREDSPDSVEYQAAVAARSDAFTASLLIMALLMLALMVVPGPWSWLWALGGLVVGVAAFWVRYQVLLGRLRG